VEPDYVSHADLTPTDLAFLDGRLWGLRNTGVNGGVAGADISVVQAWDITTGNRSVIVAVIDTGINYTHVDLAPQMWQNPGEVANNGLDDDNNGYIDDVFGINAIADNGDPRDDNGHGSHVAGTIGGAANNSGPAVGVIWEVQLMALKAFDASGSGFNTDEIECINYAISKGAPISNNSWGGYGFSQALYDSIAAARARGHLFVAAAGNDGLDTDTLPHYPSAFDLDNIIAVAALDRFDQIANFSNYGATTVDIGAPGVEIFSAWIGSNTAYNTIQGTSMASPHVAGAAALLLSASSNSDYTRLRDKLLQKVTRIPALAGITTTGGRLNLFNSISGQVDGILELSIFPPDGSYFVTNAITNLTVRVTDDFNVNNATVTGRLNGQNITFVNTGTGADTNATDGIYTAAVTMPRNPGFYTLTVNVTAPNKQPGTISATYEMVPLPPNDNFAGARKIASSGESVEGDNRLATTEPNEPLHAETSNFRSLWWNWSHATSTQVLMDLAGTSFDDSAVLAVYVGSALNNLVPVASALPTANGPNGTRAPFVNFTAEAGTTYWIAVAQFGISTNSPGQVALRVEPNGSIDTTRPIVAVTNIISGSYIRSLSNVTNIAGWVEDPRPNASGVAEVHMRVNNEILFTRIFLATNFTTLTNWSSPDIQLIPGWNTIEVKAYDRADNESATVTLTVNYIPEAGAGNDLLAMARNLPTSGGVMAGVDTATSANATKEDQEPDHAGNQGGKSVWWYFFAPADGTLFLSTGGSSFDTLLAVYNQPNPTDRSVRNLIPLSSNDDADRASGVLTSELSLAVRQGQLYYIAVDGYAGASGDVRLEYSLGRETVFTVTASVSTDPAKAGGTISIGGSDPTATTQQRSFPVNTAVEVRALPDTYRQFSLFRVNRAGVVSEIRENPYTFLLQGDTTVVAEFGPREFVEAFEPDTAGGTQGDFDLPFIIDGWTASQVTGSQGTLTWVARAVGGAHNKTNTLSLSGNFSAGNVSFDYSVSSEPSFDAFEFWVDSQRLLRRSGEVAWTRFELPLLAGTHRLEWRYVKDAALSRGQDTAFLDNIDLPTVTLQEQQPMVTVSLNQTGQITLQIVNPQAPNRTYLLQRATSLGATPAQTTWEDLQPVTANAAGTATATVSATGNQAFYRAVVN
jgi:subtilisin family serine protease